MANIGLDILSGLLWGTHFCLFHETKEDLLDTLIPYFKAGLENNEFCFWVLSEGLTTEEALGALRRNIPDLDRYFVQGDIELVTHDKWFFQAGHFDLQTIVSRFKDKCRHALSRGYVGIRVEGSSAWLAIKEPGRFSAFENDLNKLVADERMIVLCSFQIRETGADEIFSAARTHQFTIARRRGAWEIIEVPKTQTRTGSLTPREREVLAWVSRGKSAWEIGTILRITKRTVDEHVQTVVRKLGAANRTQAVAIAIRDRLIEADSPNVANSVKTVRDGLGFTWRIPA
jgi:DNA-binding CsgD family transcriptional regulator